MSSRKSDVSTITPMVARREQSRQVALMFGLTVVGAAASLMAVIALQGL